MHFRTKKVILRELLVLLGCVLLGLVLETFEHSPQPVVKGIRHIDRLGHHGDQAHLIAFLIYIAYVIVRVGIQILKPSVRR